MCLSKVFESLGSLRDHFCHVGCRSCLGGSPLPYMELIKRGSESDYNTITAAFGPRHFNLCVCFSFSIIITVNDFNSFNRDHNYTTESEVNRPAERHGK